MRRLLLLICVLCVCRCGPPIPAPSSPPATPAPPPREPAAESVIGTVRVTASALNVRRGPSTDADAIAQVRRGTALSVLESGESWTRVRLANGESGWVASRFVSSGNAPSAATARRRSGCPADSDFAFIETPTPAFPDRAAHGLVVVEATVNASGNVTATRVVSNTTGDDALAALTEREIRGAKFSPPIRNCVPRSFIFTYRRTF